MPIVQIHTDRLWLRPFAPADTDALHTVFADPVVRRYLLDDTVVPRSWVEEEIDRSAQRFTEVGSGIFGVALGPEAPPIGFAGYREFHDPPELELLYGLLPRHHGRGLAAEASRAAVRYGFETLGLDPILASVDAPNQASLRLAARLGMREVRRGPGPVHEQVYLELARACFDAGSGRFEVVS